MVAKISLLDGTRDPMWGKILGEALNEFGLHQKVRINVEPGSHDPHGYGIVKNLEEESYDPNEKKVDIRLFIGKAIEKFGTSGHPTKIFLTEEDLYKPRDNCGRGLNFAYGSTEHVTIDGVEQNYILISTSRMKTRHQFYDLVLHELGHIYGAANERRGNTSNNLGSHCTNDLCVMQQKDNMLDAEEYAARRKRTNADAYCSQCSKEINSHRGD